MPNNERFYFLFEKYLSGKASSKEKRELAEVVNTISDTELDGLLKERWDISSEEIHVFTKSESEIMLHSILQKKKVIKPAKPFFSFSFMKYAALILGFFILGTAIYYVIQGNKYSNINTVEKKAINLNEIVPGGNKAILTLGNGSSIILDTVQNGILVQEQGAKIMKTDDGKVAYNPSQDETEEITYNVISTPRGGQYQLTMADGTKVWLNAASSIRFPVSFHGKERNVEITGEAYFEVAYDPDKPFIVKLEQMDIQVLGTSFNVQAYPDEKGIETTLVKGRVMIKSGLSDSKSKELFLEPGEQAVNLKTNTTITKRKVDTNLYTSWINGEFVFQNNDLEEVLKKLARWYDFKYEFRNPKAKSTHFTGTLKRYEDIRQLGELIEYTSSLKFSVKENIIYID